MQIQQKVLRLLGAAIGIVEPHTLEHMQETIFRLQLFLPETIIQKGHYMNGYLLAFFHEQKQHFITINDLMILATKANPKKDLIESRKDFSVQMQERKARLIRKGIEIGIFFLAPRSHNLKKSDFLLLPEFDRHDNDWIYDIEIFSHKIAVEVMKGMEQ